MGYVSFLVVHDLSKSGGRLARVLWGTLHLGLFDVLAVIRTGLWVFGGDRRGETPLSSHRSRDP